jgi:hypothetical protein
MIHTALLNTLFLNTVKEVSQKRGFLKLSPLPPKKESLDGCLAAIAVLRGARVGGVTIGDYRKGAVPQMRLALLKLQDSGSKYLS